MTKLPLGKTVRWIGAIAVLTLLLLFSFKLWERSHHLSFVPDGLSVSTILYVEEESWGFGPGGNETGLIVYELPDSTAKEIQKAGIDYFTKIIGFSFIASLFQGFATPFNATGGGGGTGGAASSYVWNTMSLLLLGLLVETGRNFCQWLIQRISFRS